MNVHGSYSSSIGPTCAFKNTELCVSACTGRLKLEKRTGEKSVPQVLAIDIYDELLSS